MNRDILDFLRSAGLSPADDADYTSVLRDDGRIIATASRAGDIIKYIAVAPDKQGDNLTAHLITDIRKNAFQNGIGRLFVYTKPANRLIFEDLRFYTVAETSHILLMESVKSGINTYLNGLPAVTAGNNGAIVMNCDPFTNGHLYLVETAARRCVHLYIFSVAAQRIELIKKATAHLNNVSVYGTGGYLVSRATFPDYFLNKITDATAVQCELDAEIFNRYFVPRFGITMRFVGTEPLSPVTSEYNRILKQRMPVTEVERLTLDGEPVSAGRVRQLYHTGALSELQRLVPPATLEYLSERGLINA